MCIYICSYFGGYNFKFLGADREQAIPPTHGVYRHRDIDSGEGGGGGPPAHVNKPRELFTLLQDNMYAMTAVLMIDQYVMCATVFIILFSLGIIPFATLLIAEPLQ